MLPLQLQISVFDGDRESDLISCLDSQQAALLACRFDWLSLRRIQLSLRVLARRTKPNTRVERIVHVCPCLLTDRQPAPGMWAAGSEAFDMQSCFVDLFSYVQPKGVKVCQEAACVPRLFQSLCEDTFLFVVLGHTQVSAWPGKIAL